jgi:2-polyprenyl-3-methyl-5-hydroxy-6-metoxy-1,4-benzoquinol methylase
MNRAATSLQEARVNAANASGGVSNDTIYSAIMKVLEELGSKGSILDFGSGTGSLARRLVQSGRYKSVWAADLMEKPADLQDVQWIRADLNDPLPQPEAIFDLIVAAEVIEHLENPRAMVRELFRLLKPLGHAVISTPNNESWRSLISLIARGHYVAFCNGSYPAHITALLRRDLERIAVEAGFDPPQFRFTNVGGIPGKPKTNWQTISAGLLKGLRFSDNVIAVCRKPEGSRG